MSAPPIERLSAVTLPLLRDDVNTDAIIPSREMKRVSRDGLADGLFADWRYTAVGGREPNPAFVLNDPRYAAAQILLAGSNFGCGSSREHAAWALAEYGFRAVIAESFNPIFRGNAVLNGIVPIVLDHAEIARLAAAVKGPDGPALTLDLASLTVTPPIGATMSFALDDNARTMLREGLDMIDLTLKHSAAIAAFRSGDKRARPWAYGA